MQLVRVGSQQIKLESTDCCIVNLAFMDSLSYRNNIYFFFNAAAWAAFFALTSSTSSWKIHFKLSTKCLNILNWHGLMLGRIWTLYLPCSVSCSLFYFCWGLQRIFSPIFPSQWPGMSWEPVLSVSALQVTRGQGYFLSRRSAGQPHLKQISGFSNKTTITHAAFVSMQIS